jgi:hypothetical protein
MAGIEIVIDISRNVDQLTERYVAGEQMAIELLITGMERSINYAALNAAFYPPETEANQPPVPYYIRGTGTQYAIHNRMESQQLSDSWTKEITLDNNGVVGKLMPTATYAPFLHGMLARKLSNMAIGWRNVGEIALDVAPLIVDIFKEQVKLLKDYLTGG